MAKYLVTIALHSSVWVLLPARTTSVLASRGTLEPRDRNCGLRCERTNAFLRGAPCRSGIRDRRLPLPSIAANWRLIRRLDAGVTHPGDRPSTRLEFAPMFLCTYCVEKKDDSERSEEHVIPAALGGAWTTMDVCESCQTWANEEIDRPFNQSLWVREQRHRLAIPNRYGKVPEAPRVTAKVADGRAAVVTLSPGRWEPKVPPSTSIGGEGADSLQITVSVDDEAEYIATKVERFERANPGFTYKTTRREPTPHSPLDASFPFSIPMTLWPRFAVKVAVTVGREVYGEDWLTSEHGLLLNRLLWGRETNVVMKPLPTKRVFWAGSTWSPPPDHVVMTMDGSTGPMMLLTLFSEDSYGRAAGTNLTTSGRGRLGAAHPRTHPRAPQCRGLPHADRRGHRAIWIVCASGVRVIALPRIRSLATAGHGSRRGRSERRRAQPAGRPPDRTPRFPPFTVANARPRTAPLPRFRKLAHRPISAATTPSLIPICGSLLADVMGRRSSTRAVGCSMVSKLCVELCRRLGNSVVSAAN